jgi:hypothetical protein
LRIDDRRRMEKKEQRRRGLATIQIHCGGGLFFLMSEPNYSILVLLE